MPNLLRGLIGTEAITILNYTSDLAKLELAEILRRHRIDSVQIEGVHLSRYVGVIREVCPKARIIADWHNIESEIMWRYAESAAGRLRRLMARRTAPLIERAEQELLRKCDAHTVCSGKDRETLLRRCPAARIEVVPNGVDVEYYSAEPETRPVPLRDVLFVGTMDYHANVEAVIWFTRTVWPLVKASNPELVFRIVGRDPLPEIRALSAPDVVVTGTVDDIRPCYARAAATVVPLRVGGGTRLKILESMAAKVPVVSTRLGAEGIELRDGTDILLAESPAEIAQNLKSLIDDKALAERLRNHGHALVKRLYDWSVPGARLYAIHREIHSAGRGSFGTSTINS
jgi:glycosyltransferase involved in cell wall biosynthesis